MARQRLVGGFNRIIGGILLHSVRRDASICDVTRFPEIQNFCLGDYVVEPFGVDPVFKPATDSFNPDLSELDMLRAYNCTEDFGSDAVRPSSFTGSLGCVPPAINSFLRNADNVAFLLCLVFFGLLSFYTVTARGLLPS